MANKSTNQIIDDSEEDDDYVPTMKELKQAGVELDLKSNRNDDEV